MIRKQFFAILAPKTWSLSIISVLIGTFYSKYRYFDNTNKTNWQVVKIISIYRR